MMHSNAWMMDGYGRDFHGDMFGSHFGGGVDGFGPVSVFTISIFSVMFLLALLWSIAIKGYALWHAAKRDEKWWFIALLVINTFGILELVYLFLFAKVFGRNDTKNVVGATFPVSEKSVEATTHKEHKDHTSAHHN